MPISGVLSPIDPVMFLNGAAGPTPGDVAQNFDGTDDHFRADNIHSTGGQNGLYSVWFRRDTSGSQEFLGSSAGSRWAVLFNATDEFRILLKDSGGTTRLDLNSGTTKITDTNWHNALISWELDATPTSHFYLDDLDVKAVGTESNGSIDWANLRDTWGADGAGTAARFFDGCLSEWWMGPGEFLDLSITSNRRKFIDALGNPVDLGADGSIPVLVAPEVYYKDDFTDNLGFRGNPTAFGTPAACSDAPG